MQVNLLLPRTFRLLSACLFLSMGLMLATVSSIRAEDKPEDLELRDGKTIEIDVKNLEAWIKDKDQKNDYKNLALCIDELPFNGLQPVPNCGNTKLLYTLKQTSDNKDAWNAVLSKKRDKFFSRTVSVTISPNNLQIKEKPNQKLEAIPKKYNLIIINPTWFTIFVIVFVTLLFVFFWLAKTSDMLREPGPAKGDERKPYSLARTQMAFWFFTVIISFVYIWLVKDNLYCLTGSVLVLMGISAATALSSAVVDSGKRNDIERLREDKAADEATQARLEKEIADITSKITASPPPPDLEVQKELLATKTKELEKKKAEIEQHQTDMKIQTLSKAIKPVISKSFWADILNEDNGISKIGRAHV